MQNEYLIEIKVKNNVLYSLMEAKRISTAAELSRATSVAQSIIGKYLNLKMTALKQNGEPTNAAYLLAAFFNVDPEHLFPVNHYYESLEDNKGITSASFESINDLSIGDNNLLSNSVDFDNEELKKSVDDALLLIRPREAETLKLRFGIDCKLHTLDEVGRILNVTRERVRQLEAKALKKLTNPKINKNLKEFLENEGKS